MEKVPGPEHPDTGVLLNNLASVYHEQGRYAEAEALFKRSLAIREKALEPQHPDVGGVLINLANLYGDQGHYTEAKSLLQRSLAIGEKTLGREHLQVAMMLHYLAVLAHDEGDWARAAEYWQRSTDMIKQRAGRNLAGTVEGYTKGEAQRGRSGFLDLVSVTYRLAAEGRTPDSAPASPAYRRSPRQGSRGVGPAGSRAAALLRGPLPRMAAPGRARGGGVGRVEMRDGLANVEHLRAQLPLPETADELCAVARAVNADMRDIRLGAQATKREVKRLSARGELARYRILRFATRRLRCCRLTGSPSRRRA
jgi:tetratricopeptide (TPR) repeat protein